MKYVRWGLLLGILCSQVATAFALSGAVLLPFAQAYESPDGSSCLHRGVDVSFAAGDEVTSPVAGTVTFAGRIPGPHGGSVLALTVETDQGRVTLLPLEGLSVAKGEALAAGDVVGECAGEGDPSSAASHIHMSLRKGDVYVDPAALLMAPLAPSQPEAEPEAVPVPSGGEQPAAAPAVSVPEGRQAQTPAPTTVRTSSSTAVHAATPVEGPAVTAHAAQQTASAEGAPISAGGTGELAPGVSLAQPVAAAASVATPLAMSPAARVASRAAQAAAPAVSFAAGHVAASIGVAAGALLGIAIVITRKALTRRALGPRARVRPVWDRVAAPDSR